MKVLVPFVLLVLSTTLYAQTNATQQLVSPFSDIVPDCGQRIVVSGTIYGHIQTTSNKNMTTIHTVWGPRNDVQAIDIDTGATYNSVGITVDKYLQLSNGVITFGFADEFKLVGLYTVHYNYLFKVKTDANGNFLSFTAVVENFKAVCQ